MARGFILRASTRRIGNKLPYPESQPRIIINGTLMTAVMNADLIGIQPKATIKTFLSRRLFPFREVLRNKRESSREFSLFWVNETRQKDALKKVSSRLQIYLCRFKPHKKFQTRRITLKKVEFMKKRNSSFDPPAPLLTTIKNCTTKRQWNEITNMKIPSRDTRNFPCFRLPPAFPHLCFLEATDLGLFCISCMKWNQIKIIFYYTHLRFIIEVPWNAKTVDKLFLLGPEIDVDLLRDERKFLVFASRKLIKSAKENGQGNHLWSETVKILFISSGKTFPRKISKVDVWQLMGSRNFSDNFCGIAQYNPV